jgi:tetratricopeptide (TPR) repeat protein
MRSCWFLALSLTLFLAAPAHAQEPAVEADYDVALTHALEAHAAGDYAQAEQAMKLAHALSPNARTLRGLGVILYAQGRYVEAIEPLEQALDCQVKPLSAELRQGVEELLARVWQRVGRLLLRVEPGDNRVLVDGVEPRRHGQELVLTAGEHRVEVSAPGRQPYALTLQSRPGSQDSLHVVLAALPSALSVTSEAALPPVALPARHDALKASAVARNSLLVAGGALLVTGAVSWGIGFARYRDLYDECQQNPCDDAIAREGYEDKRIGPLTTTGAVLLSVGAAALLTAGALELWHYKTRKAHASVPRARLSLRGAGLGLQGWF